MWEGRGLVRGALGSFARLCQILGNIFGVLLNYARLALKFYLVLLLDYLFFRG